jgi:hypothetical protein
VTEAGGRLGFPIGSPRRARGRLADAISQRTNLLPALLALAGIILPSELQVSIAGAKFTPGRMAAALLLVPALVMLFQKGRRLLICDFFALATASWMIAATLYREGAGGLAQATGGEALDFLGGYLVARGFFFGRSAIDTFVRVLKIFAIIAVIFAVVDSISGRYLVHETIAKIVNASSWPEVGFRRGIVRAASTFEHAISFGVFCALAAAILLYWEESWLRRILSVSICLLGCILSFSSAALMALSISLSAYVYDRLLRQYSWRWIVLWIVLGTLFFSLIAVTNNPLSWIIRNLTLDPWTGYYRVLIWDLSTYYIALAPITGYGYTLFNNNVLDSTVDSIWLVHSLRFGLPMTIFLFLTNLAAFFPTTNHNNDFQLGQMCRAFTLVLLIFMFTGLTVHFWNFMWMFWGLCIGIRGSLRELSLERASQSYRLSYPVSARTVSPFTR